MDATYWIIGLLIWFVVGGFVAIAFGRATGPRDDMEDVP